MSPLSRLWRAPRARMLARVIALVLVVWLFVVPQLTGSAASLPLLFDIDNGWLPAALGAELLSLGLYTLATRSLLPRERRPTLGRVARIDLSSIALGHCLPDGGAAGTALCWRLLVRAGVPSGEAAFSKLVQGLGSAVVLQAMVLVALLTGSLWTGFSPWGVLPATVAAVILAAGAIAAACAQRAGLRQRIGRALQAIPRYGPRVGAAIDGAVRRVASPRLSALISPRHRIVSTLAWVAGNWVFDAVALWACLHAFGVSVGLSGMAIVFALHALSTWLPITPNGLGVAESLMIPALFAEGAGHTGTVLGILAWRLVAFWLPIPLGLVAFVTLRPARTTRTV